MHRRLTPRLTILALSLALTGLPLHAAEPLGNYSAWTADGPVAGWNPATVDASSLVDAARPPRIDSRGNLPSFLWAAPQPAVASARAAAPDLRPAAVEQAARQHLGRFAKLYRMATAAMQDNARLLEIHDTGEGGIIARFQQEVNGIEVFDRRMGLLMDRSLQLRAISGHFAPQSGQTTRAVQNPFRLGMPRAIAAAFADLHQEDLPAARLRLDRQRGEYQWYSLNGTATAHRLDGPVRIKRVFYPLADGLEAAYYLELNTEAANDEQSHYGYVISAVDGRLLSRTNLAHDAGQAFTYRVWAANRGLHLPMDSPYGNGLTPVPAVPLTRPAVPLVPNLVTLGCASLSVCDPWLPPTATRTIGNNVNAYADISRPNHFNSDGDLHAELTGPNTFDYAYDFSLPDDKRHPDQLKAAIVQAFYTTNLMHDWLYDHGFNEPAGNAQDQNYGRGGEEADRMLVEVADFGGMNNANMYTPRDGAAPVMQMYLWTHPGKRRFQVKDAAGASQRFAMQPAEFGPQDYDLGDTPIVPVNDGAGVRTDGCEAPFVNAARISGAIALIDRGTCLFVDKAMNAQRAGAVGVVVVNNVAGSFQLGGDDRRIRIPVIGIRRAAGESVRQIIADGRAAGQPVTAALSLEPRPAYNAALDNTVVIHEWGHMLSDRLASLDNNQGWSLGEGWSDFLALLALVQPGDRNLPGNESFQAAYPMAAYVMPKQPRDYAFGLRRYPYSSDMAINPLTFRHISNGERLPRDVPAGPDTDKSGSWNSEVHNSGEVWAAMLWDAYVGLLNDRKRLSFAQARDRMLSYLVASLKMTPADPTFLEARDALLAVAEARDPKDYRIFWAAFAKRGAGINAIAPRRYSRTHIGVVESYETP